MPSEQRSKIAFVVPYPHDWAPGQRFRYEQYLQEVGKIYDYRLLEFIDAKTNTILYREGLFFQKSFGFLKAFCKRFFDLFYISNCDAVFIFREASMIGPPVFEWIIAKILRKPIIFDYDDAIWLPNVSEANKFWRWLKNPGKTEKIVKWSAYVIAGNSFLANYAKRYNTSVLVIPTTIDTSYHVVKPKNRPNGVITIGWTGSETTIKHFKQSYEFLSALKRKYGNLIRVVLISNRPVTDAPFDVDFVEWNKKTEIEDLLKLDIGIMPLPEDEWARGKCGFKGLQYMSLEIPTVMSPVGVNNEIIKHGENGYLANTNEEWIKILSGLIEDEELRINLGKQARTTVEDYYSVRANTEKYLFVINKVIKK